MEGKFRHVRRSVYTLSNTSDGCCLGTYLKGGRCERGEKDDNKYAHALPPHTYMVLER